MIGPYLIIELAINQPMGSPKISWTNDTFESFLEPNGNKKYQTYLNRYMDYISNGFDQCLGSFAFASSNSSRITHNWYNLILDDRLTTLVYDAMHYAWKGEHPKVFASRITKLLWDWQTDQGGIVINKHKAHTVFSAYENQDPEKYTIRYEIRLEDDLKGSRPNQPLGVSFTVDSYDKRKAYYASSQLVDGIYRIYAYVYNGFNKVGSSSLPFKLATNIGNTSRPSDQVPVSISWRVSRDEIEMSISFNCITIFDLYGNNIGTYRNKSKVDISFLPFGVFIIKGTLYGKSIFKYFSIINCSGVRASILSKTIRCQLLIFCRYAFSQGSMHLCGWASFNSSTDTC